MNEFFDLLHYFKYMKLLVSFQVFHVLNLQYFTDVKYPMTQHSQRREKTQLLAKWVRAAGMIAWIFKMKQLQTEASVTIMLVPRSVKQWQYVVQLQLYSEQLLNISADTKREGWGVNRKETKRCRRSKTWRNVLYVGWMKRWQRVSILIWGAL